MNFFEFNKKFPTELACIKHFIKIRYAKATCCNHCGSNRISHRHDFPKMFQCNGCANSFSIFKGTIFEKSCTDLRKWMYAIHLFLNSKKGVSGYQLQREVGVTYKTAWRMLQKIREAMKNDDEDNNQDGGILKGFVEIDECYIGGKAENMHMSKRVKAKGIFAKECIIGMVERQGKIKAFHVESAHYHVLGKKVLDNVKTGSTIITDEHKSYIALRNFYNHTTVNHSKGEYKKDDAFTNTIEGFWVTLKRGIIGIYHHVSKEYLQNYVSEFCFRYNNRENLDIFDLVLKQSIVAKKPEWALWS